MTILRDSAKSLALSVVVGILLLCVPSAAQSKTLTGCGGFHFEDTNQKIRSNVGSDSRTAFLLGKEWLIVYNYDDDGRLFQCDYKMVDEAFKDASSDSCRTYALEVEAELERQRDIGLLGIQEAGSEWKETYRYPNGSVIKVSFEWGGGQHCVGTISYIKQQKDDRRRDPVTF